MGNGIITDLNIKRALEERVNLGNIVEENKARWKQGLGKLAPRWDIVPDEFAFEKGLKKIIDKIWGLGGGHFRIEAETRKYRPSKSLEVREQLAGRAPKRYEVYFDNQYLCEVSEAQLPEEVDMLLHTSMQNLLAKKL